MALGNEPSSGLDPEDWDAFEQQLKLIAQNTVHHLKHIREQPVWTRPTTQARAAFRQPAPQKGIGVKNAYEEFNQNILPHITGNIHPRFWGWVVGSGAPASMVGDWLAAFANGAPTLFDDSCLLTELQVIDWLKELLQLEMSASGILTTGASEATLIALTVARYAALGPDIKNSGVFSLRQTPVFYVSDQTHDCARKAIEILGFGRDHIRTIKTDDAFQMDCRVLAEKLQADLDQNRKPIAVIATLGTVNTGAIDDIRKISAICRAHDVWLHVDAAFGAWASLSTEHRNLRDGLAGADSVVVDLHKWMFQCYDLGCAFVRDGELHKAALSTSADYIAPIKGSLTDSDEHLSTRAIQLSRGFKALKLWFSLKSEGIASFAAAIEENLRLARYLVERIEAIDSLEILAPAPLHIVNCRYVGALMDPDKINHLNTAILQRLHMSGFAIPSSTVLNGKFAIRICISNHRTRQSDLDEFIDQFIAIGKDVEAELSNDKNAGEFAANDGE